MPRIIRLCYPLLTLFLKLVCISPAFAEDETASSAELAKKLQNPIASLISVPLQNNWAKGYGPKDATRYTLNVQPVIPISLDDDWNIITRTIMPVVHQDSPAAGIDSETGMGDILQSFFFSPKEPSQDGWIWGVGPALIYATGDQDLINGEKWAAGPTAVVLKQKNGWTYGGLTNHLLSYAGSSERSDVNATFLQFFLAYTTKTYTTFTLDTESTYDWQNNEWTVPVLLQVSQLVKVGGVPVNFGVAPQYYAKSPATGTEWGMRFLVQLIFPK